MKKIAKFQCCVYIFFCFCFLSFYFIFMASTLLDNSDDRHFEFKMTLMYIFLLYSYVESVNKLSI